jgi:molecular chaperone GrpE
MSKRPTIKELEQQIGELTEALQRERADAQNLRRRTEEERAQLTDFYKAMVLRELLPALDNLERALKHAPLWENGEQVDSKVSKKDAGAWAEWARGVLNIKNQFEDCFAKLGVERIKTVGEHFDPRLHEAVHMEDGAGTVEVVCEELQPGYKIGDEVIRHAMVKVKMEKK